MSQIATVAPRTINLPRNAVEALQSMVDHPPTPPALALAGEADPHLNVFVFNFDGTGNDRDHVRPGEVETMVARFDRHFAAEQSDSFRSLYLAGVNTPASMKAAGHAGGTIPDAGTSVAEGMIGRGVAERAYDALKAFREFVDERRAADPKARFHVHINAFSRGCASALILANRLHEMDAEMAKRTGRDVDGSFVRSTGVLLDAVTTGVATPLGVVADAVQTGLEGAWFGRVRKEDLQLPPTAAAFLHLVSGGEERDSFSSRDLLDPLRPSEIAWARGIYSSATAPDHNAYVQYQRLTTLKLPMLSHTDMAAGFPGSSTNAVVEFQAASYMQALGLPIHPVKPTAEHMESLTAAHWGRRQMADDLVFDTLNRMPFISKFRAAVAWVDKLIRQPGSLSDSETSEKSLRTRRIGAAPKELLPGAEELLVSQEAEMVRTGSMEPVIPIEGVDLKTSTPVMAPEGAEGLMSPQQAHRVESIYLNVSGADVQASPGYYFDRLGTLHRGNHSRVIGAPMQHQLSELIQLNGPLTLVIHQEKAIPVAHGRQLPNAKAVFEAMVASAKPLAPARQAQAAAVPPSLGGGLFSPQSTLDSRPKADTVVPMVRRPRMR
ncbi:hypothetical protein ABIC83_002486 [Roseateles asaccharophilus]|uniref:hypothetical protein n=1 Tax=Roseateles asaccharophilus TaxID=582607 RepID=UPI0038365461